MMALLKHDFIYLSLSTFYILSKIKQYTATETGHCWKAHSLRISSDMNSWTHALAVFHWILLIALQGKGPGNKKGKHKIPVIAQIVLHKVRAANNSPHFQKNLNNKLTSWDMRGFFFLKEFYERNPFDKEFNFQYLWSKIFLVLISMTEGSTKMLNVN